jgi:glycyl-tRNA synthetase
LSYLDSATGERFIPHVIEPTFGLDRNVLAVLTAGYEEQELSEGDTRVVLHLKPELAPVKIAVSPLLRNKPELVEQARSIYKTLKVTFGSVLYDDNGNIGKRYRRQDEIGTPLCIVIDFDTLTDHAVTVRHRDTMEQNRVPIADLVPHITSTLETF